MILQVSLRLPLADQQRRVLICCVNIKAKGSATRGGFDWLKQTANRLKELHPLVGSHCHSCSIQDHLSPPKEHTSLASLAGTTEHSSRESLYWGRYLWGVEKTDFFCTSKLCN